MTAAEAHQARRAAEMRQYSRTVGWMKIALPIAAVCLIALIFFTGRDRNAVVDARTAADVAALGAGLKLDNPRFAGTTDAGDPFVVTADWALPDGAMPNLVGLEKPKGEIHLGNGLSVTVEAKTGEMRRKDEQLHLLGDVDLRTSDGYRARTRRVELDLANKTAVVPGPVQAAGPRGELEADSMRVDRATPETRDVVVRFEGNVRLRILPKDQ